LATKSDPARPFVKPKTEFGNRILSEISWGDIVPSPMSKLWARAIALESEPYLDLLERILYRGIETATGSLVCEIVRASFPGDPEHTDALLKAIGGSDN
jgi:hypothetical protein